MCGRLEFGHGKITMNVEEDDRLSSLPDDLIHLILSFVSARQAIRTSALSSRWRFMWTSMPYLYFSNEDLFPNFKGTPTWSLPAALKMLHLDHVTLSNEHTGKGTSLFSKCTNLKNLSLTQCRIVGSYVFRIAHPLLSDLTISNLTFENTNECLKFVSVGAPQLKNLTVECCDDKHVMMISAPRLTSLVMKGDRLLRLGTDGFHSAEKVNLCIYNPLQDAKRIACVLQQLRNVKFLTLNLRILEVLSESKEKMSNQPYAFPNVKIIKFTTSFPVMVRLEVQAQEKEKVTTESVASPSDIFTMVSYEEIRVIKDIISAQTLMKDLQEMLKSKNSNTNNAKRKMHEHDKAQVKKQLAKSALELQGHFRKTMAETEQGKIEGLLIKKMPTSETRDMASRLRRMITLLQKIFSSLQCIEKLVTKLPASKRAVMQAMLSNLFEDAAILMNNLLGLCKDLMDEGMRLIRMEKP